MSDYEILTLDQLLKRLEKYNHKELHVHHTWQPDHKTYNSNPDGIYWQEAMRRYHMEELGWSDIGQHVTLLPDGKFVAGRPFDLTPASISGYNLGAFAVEMLGNFDAGADPFDGAQRDSAIKLAAWFDKRGCYIRFHRENSAKTCPGSGIEKEEFMRAVRGENGEAVIVMYTRGSRGDGVKALQLNLQALGYSPGVPDGIFGALTEEAVKAFQWAHGLPVDGIAGPLTQAKIDEMIKAKAKPEPPAVDYKKLYEEAQMKLEQIKKIII